MSRLHYQEDKRLLFSKPSKREGRLDLIIGLFCALLFHLVLLFVVEVNVNHSPKKLPYLPPLAIEIRTEENNTTIAQNVTVSPLATRTKPKLLMPPNKPLTFRLPLPELPPLELAEDD